MAMRSSARVNTRKRAREEDTYSEEEELEQLEEDSHSSDAYEPEDGGESDASQASIPPADDDGVVEIEQENFTRLIHAFTNDPSEKKGAKGRNPTWTASMEQEMESFHHELRGVNGYARKSKPTQVREQALSAEVKALLAQANMAYVEADLPRAIRQLEEVIRIEPTVKGAWYTLGMCFEEMGEEEKSIQCRIVGAHLTSNASDEWKSLARRSRERGLFQQSIYCLQQAIKKNRYDIDAVWDRAVMLKDSGRSRAAVESFQAILKIQPYDTEVLCELIPLLVSLGDYDMGVTILENMRRASMMNAPSDANLDPALVEDSGAHFSLNELVTLADLLLLLRRPFQVILVIKQTVRWLRGAAREDRPGDAQSDLELDDALQSDPMGLDHEVRLRLGKARFMLKDFDEGRRHFSILADEAEPTENPLLFLEMTECYFEYQQYADALEWYRLLVDDGLVDDLQAWMHMGVCYQQLDMPSEAAQVYEPILRDHPDNFDAKLGLAEVYEELGERDKALHLVNQVLTARNGTPQSADELRPGHCDGEEGGASLSFFDEAAPPGGAGMSATAQATPRVSRSGISFADRQRLEQQREEETRLALVQLSALEPLVFIDGLAHHDVVFLDGPLDAPSESSTSDEAEKRRFDATRQWMQVAGRLIDAFRSMPLLFPKERYTKYRGVVRPRRTRRSKGSDLDSHAQDLLSRLRDHLVDEATLQAEGMEEVAPEQDTFRTIHFDDWVALFMKYAIGLAKLGEHAAIHDMFRHIMVSNTVWPSEKRKMSLYLCWLACAMYARDHARVFDIVRWFPTHFQFHDEPLRLIASIANAMGFYGVDAFVSATNTKQYQRRMRTHEAIVSGKPAKINTRSGRWTMAYTGEDEEQGAEEQEDESRLAPGISSKAQPLPTQSSPIGEMFYGYLMLCANSYQPAMGYLLRALALQPNDPLLCLLCSVACLSRATNRQVDNRNHTIIQGLGILAQYATLRGPGPEAENVLALAEKSLNQEHGFTMAREAAFNLAHIYASSGSPHLAHALYTQWLSFTDTSMTPTLRVAVLLAALACSVQCAQYSLLHRVLDVNDGHALLAWQPRAVLDLPSAEGVSYQPLSTPAFEIDTDDALYELALVSGDARMFDAEAWADVKRGVSGPSLISKLCQFRTSNTEPLTDRLDVYMADAEFSSPVGLAYGVDAVRPLGANACPEFGDEQTFLGHAFQTQMHVHAPATPEVPLRMATQSMPTAVPGQKEEETKKPVENPLNDPVSFLKKYWMYLLPIVVLMMLPAGEDVPQGLQRAQAQAQAVQGQGQAKAIVTPGPAKRGGRKRG
ncbi:hypothetical protein MVES1_001197 [Malassezia vespertilionis]|uniref:uncharacterized protein n=1 Tax=Malassezia vespertilionis TaxID=2020962 RepID=UPI0024B12D41|nr:uncharacterized protein MVES1_001197 [Malassezia vespertilionis]WFD05863.1 hypothetical protein MVES1_001197 [Malassezia vespertilionis]